MVLAKRLQVRTNYAEVGVLQVLYRLQFYDNRSLYKEVQLVNANEDSIVMYRDFNLLIYPQPPFTHFKNERFLIDGLNKTRSQFLVNLYPSRNNAVGQFHQLERQRVLL